MDTKTLYNTVAGHFHTNVADALGITTLYPNAPGDPPTNQRWCRITPELGEQDLISFGAGNEYRQFGTLTVQIFDLPETGPNGCLEVADVITNVFRGAKVNGIVFKEPSTKTVDNEEKDAWFQVNVYVDFHVDDTGTGDSTPVGYGGIIDQRITLVAGHQQPDDDYKITITHAKGRPVLSLVIDTTTGTKRNPAEKHPDDNNVEFYFPSGSTLVNKELRFILL